MWTLFFIATIVAASNYTNYDCPENLQAYELNTAARRRLHSRRRLNDQQTCSQQTSINNCYEYFGCEWDGSVCDYNPPPPCSQASESECGMNQYGHCQFVDGGCSDMGPGGPGGGGPPPCTTHFSGSESTPVQGINCDFVVHNCDTEHQFMAKQPGCSYTPQLIFTHSPNGNAITSVECDAIYSNIGTMISIYGTTRGTLESYAFKASTDYQWLSYASPYPVRTDATDPSKPGKRSPGDNVCVLYFSDGQVSNVFTITHAYGPPPEVVPRYADLSPIAGYNYYGLDTTGQCSGGTTCDFSQYNFVYDTSTPSPSPSSPSPSSPSPSPSSPSPGPSPSNDNGLNYEGECPFTDNHCAINNTDIDTCVQNCADSTDCQGTSNAMVVIPGETYMGFTDLGLGNCRNSAENYLPLYKANDRTKEQCEGTCSSESDCIGYTWHTSDYDGYSDVCGLYFSDCTNYDKYIGDIWYYRQGQCYNGPIEDAGTGASGSTYYITGGNCYRKGELTAPDVNVCVQYRDDACTNDYTGTLPTTCKTKNLITWETAACSTVKDTDDVALVLRSKEKTWETEGDGVCTNVNKALRGWQHRFDWSSTPGDQHQCPGENCVCKQDCEAKSECIGYNAYNRDNYDRCVLYMPLGEMQETKTINGRTYDNYARQVPPNSLYISETLAINGANNSNIEGHDSIGSFQDSWGSSPYFYFDSFGECVKKATVPMDDAKCKAACGSVACSGYAFSETQCSAAMDALCECTVYTTLTTVPAMAQGVCTDSTGGHLRSIYRNSYVLSPTDCKAYCDAVSECIGYAHSPSGHCRLYMKEGTSTNSRNINNDYFNGGDPALSAPAPIAGGSGDSNWNCYYNATATDFPKSGEVEPYDYLLYENLDHSAIDCNYLSVSVDGTTAGVALATCQTACDAEDNCIYVGVNGTSCILYMTSSTLNTTTKTPDTCYGRNSKLLTCSDEVECAPNIYYTFKQEFGTNTMFADMHVYRWNVSEDFTFTSRGNTYTQSLPLSISRNQSKAIQDLETMCTNMPECIAYAIENDDEYSIITDQSLHSENSPTTMEYIGAGPCNNNPLWQFDDQQVSTEQKCRELCSGYDDCVGYDFKITGNYYCRMYTRNMCNINTGYWVGNIYANASGVQYMGYQNQNGHNCQRGENIVVYDISGGDSDYSCYAKRKVHSSLLYVGQMKTDNTFQIDTYFNKVVVDHLNPKLPGTLCISGQCNDGTCCDVDSTKTGLCSSVTCPADEQHLDWILCGDQCNSQTCCQESKCNNVDCGDSKLKEVDGAGTTENECCQDIKKCGDYCSSGVISGRYNDPIPNPFDENDDVNILYCCACQTNQYFVSSRCEDCANDKFSQGGAVRQCESCPSGKQRYQHSDNSWDETCFTCDVSQVFHNNECTTCSTGSVPKANREEGCETCAAGKTTCISWQWDTTCSGLECESCPYVWNYIDDVDRECKFCPNHQIVDKTSNADGVCTNCPAGYDRYTQSGVPNIGVKPYCFTKAYTDPQFDSSSYDDCSESQLTTCTECAAGRFSNTPGAQCQAKQTCASGQFISNEGSTTEDRTCENCPSGWVRLTYKGAGDADACKACPAGYYQDEAGQTTTNTNHALDCVTCPEGYYSGSAGASKCERCPFGSYPINKYGQSVFTKCELCSNGYSESYIDDQFGCIDCPAHQVPNSTGNGCEDKCLPNQVHSDDKCIVCPVGRYRGASSTQCEVCTLKGGADDWLKYQDESSQTSCKTCPNGYYASGSPGSSYFTECVGCSEGRFLDVNVVRGLYDPPSDACTYCPFGQYNTQPNQEACVNCPEGYAHTVIRESGEENKVCTIAPQHTYVNNPGRACRRTVTENEIKGDSSVGCYSSSIGKRALDGCCELWAGNYKWNRTCYSDNNIAGYGLWDNLNEDCFTSCPDNSHTTSNGSTSINDCLCDQDYYGSSGSCTACPANSQTLSTNSLVFEDCKCKLNYFHHTGCFNSLNQLTDHLNQTSCEAHGRCLTASNQYIESNTRESCESMGSCSNNLPSYTCMALGTCWQNVQTTNSACTSYGHCKNTYNNVISTNMSQTECTDVGRCTYTIGSTSDVALGYDKNNCTGHMCIYDPVLNFWRPEGNVLNYQDATNCTTHGLCVKYYPYAEYFDVTSAECDTHRNSSSTNQAYFYPYKWKPLSWTTFTWTPRTWQQNILFTPHTYGEGCAACPGGWFQDQTGQSECRQCNPNQFGVAGGDCQDCPAGYHSTEAGETCDLCAKGKFSDTAGQSCQDCPAGRYGYGNHRTVCNVGCPRGSSTGNHTDASKPHASDGFCFECLDGYVQYGLNHATDDYSCQACPLGRYEDDHYTCKTCPAGKMTSSEATSGGCPINCAAGTYSTGNGGPCLECEVGTYNTAIGQSSCSNCFAGETTNGTAQTSCIFCAEGKFSNGTGGECQTCPTNHYTTGNGEAECLACPAGYHSNDGICTACPSGYHSNAGESCLPCLSGTFTPPGGKCEVCPTGFYSQAVNSPPTACTACAAGQFNSQTRQSACVDCPVGTSYSGTGATVCDDCEPGKYNDQIGLSTCKNCQAGRFMGEYKALECEDCGIHHAQSAEGQTFCTLCDEKSYQTQTGQAQCIACNNNELSYYTNETSGCIKSCEAGQYNQDGTCESCPVLHVAPIRHIGTSCTPCQEGQVANNARVKCENCPQGTYFAIGQCLGCPAGKYQDEEGQLGCKTLADSVFGFTDVHPEKTGLCPYTTTHYRDASGCHACESLEDGYFCQRYLNGRYPTSRHKVHHGTECHMHFKLNGKVCSETECESGFALVEGHCVACSEYESEYNELTCSDDERSTYKEIIQQYC